MESFLDCCIQAHKLESILDCNVPVSRYISWRLQLVHRLCLHGGFCMGSKIFTSYKVTHTVIRPAYFPVGVCVCFQLCTPHVTLKCYLSSVLPVGFFAEPLFCGCPRRGSREERLHGHSDWSALPHSPPQGKGEWAGASGGSHSHGPFHRMGTRWSWWSCLLLSGLRTSLKIECCSQYHHLLSRYV